MGERKEDVEYWLFTHEQSSHVLNHRDLRGRGFCLSLESFSFRAME